MELSSPNNVATDVLIIGGGGAGLRAGIEARERGVNVLIVSHSRVGYGSNTTISGGGFAAVLASSMASEEPTDSPEQHLVDTVTGGFFLNVQSPVVMVAWVSGEKFL